MLQQTQAAIEKTAASLHRALVERFVHDPKLANEVVTGTCVWPPLADASEDDRDPEGLAFRAANLAHDLRAIGGSPLRIQFLLAAEEAFLIIHKEQEDERLQAEIVAEEAAIEAGLRFNPYREYGISKGDFL